MQLAKRLATQLASLKKSGIKKRSTPLFQESIALCQTVSNAGNCSEIVPQTTVHRAVVMER
ncbi:hypothetical protein H6G52_11820 [Limnothrix sp. FACHB-881]|uniref:hypothetical protein n=1 Tax=Limnothrix sp. FACHB-881 TaxID=2692819 RepID=UPI001689B4F6|nr:hypothetical protein [Limnothrix sp. FACHB-881]MBD2636049.1 hypothetical protein [Limnothrix sp. FACHB-881]